jgi:hypothetical protein
MCFGTPMHSSSPYRNSLLVGFLILILLAASTIPTPLSLLSASLPSLKPISNWRSNPIAHRVRRKRQRLPPILLIENASDRDPAPPQESAPRRFRSRLATTHPESRLVPSVLVATKGLSWTVKRTKNLLSDFGVTFGLFLDTYYEHAQFQDPSWDLPERVGNSGTG